MARSLRKKAMALNALLQRDDLRTLLQQFVEWIIAAGAINKVLGRLPRIAETLSRIEAAMSQGDSLPQALNSQPVTTEEIRRLGLFAAFLVEIGVLTQTNRARAEVSEHRRIRQMLSQIGAKPWCASVRDYATEIADPAVKLSLRTQRVYLRAAIELMDFSQVERISELTNAQVRSFLRKRPGHRASLARWVSRVRRVTGHPLGLPARAGQRSRAVAAIASDVRVLDGAIEATTSRRAQRALLAQLLATLYGVPLEHVLSLDRDCLAVSPGRVRLQVGEEWITIASPVDRLVATVLADAADPRRSAMLFPGRLPDDGLSTTAVRYHVRQALDKN